MFLSTLSCLLVFIPPFNFNMRLPALANRFLAFYDRLFFETSCSVFYRVSSTLFFFCCFQQWSKNSSVFTFSCLVFALSLWALFFLLLPMGSSFEKHYITYNGNIILFKYIGKQLNFENIINNFIKHFSIIIFI